MKIEQKTLKFDEISCFLMIFQKIVLQIAENFIFFLNERKMFVISEATKKLKNNEKNSFFSKLEVKNVQKNLKICLFC